MDDKNYEEVIPRLEKMVAYAQANPNLEFPIFKEDSPNSVNPKWVLRFLLERNLLQSVKNLHVRLDEEKGIMSMVYISESNVDLTEVLRKNNMLVKQKGTEFVTFKGLLYVATKFCNVISITPEPMLEWSDPEVGSFYFRSTVVVRDADGTEHTYTEYGDANHDNVGNFIKPHTFRMASTRATVRALRLALGVGVAGLDEIVADEDSLDKVKDKIKGRSI